MNSVAIKLIQFYQVFSKTVLRQGAGFFIVPVSCRYYPTCSDYAISAFSNHNFIKALTMSLVRVTRCNPWTKPKPDTVKC